MFCTESIRIPLLTSNSPRREIGAQKHKSEIIIATTPWNDWFGTAERESPLSKRALPIDSFDNNFLNYI